MESISKMMNGHSDVMLGLLCGRDDSEPHLRDQLSVWGLASSPFDCWLASRGLATLHLRMERACDSARKLADLLAAQPAVTAVHYPTLANAAQQQLAQQQFLADRAGSMLTFTLAEGLAGAERFMAAAREIPFCPSLGEVATTISHPSSTSHRGLSAEQQRHLGIEEGTLRLSVGTESLDFVQDVIMTGLAAV